jgi:hypothetical protein
MMTIRFHLIETIYEIFSNEERKSFFYLKKWQKNYRFTEKPMSNVKASAYPAYRQAGAGRQRSNQ